MKIEQEERMSLTFTLMEKFHLIRVKEQVSALWTQIKITVPT